MRIAKTLLVLTSLLVGPASIGAAELPVLSPAIAQRVAAEHRVALVIGNSAYQSAPLPKSRQDAEAMGRLLKAAGFEVVSLMDASAEAVQRAIRQVAEKAGPQGTVLLYYSGHAMAIDGKEYLIPTDLKSGGDLLHLQHNSINLGDMLSQFRHPGPLLAFFDTCRNNPFFKSWDSLAAAPAPALPGGSLIVYASLLDTCARSGPDSEPTSLYTTQLLSALSQPGREITAALQVAITETAKRTDGRQIPEYRYSLLRPFTLFPTD